MKAIKKINLVLILVAAIIASSCTSNDVVETLTGGNYVKATIDGSSYSSLTASAIKTGTGAGTTIIIIGVGPTAQNMNMTLIGINAKGTYALSESSDSVLSYIDPKDLGATFGTGGCGATGTITVTTLDATKIEGTFNFTGKNISNCDTAAKNITNGSFSVAFK